VGNPNHRRSISTKATKSSIYVCYEHRAVACSTGPKENTGQALPYSGRIQAAGLIYGWQVTPIGQLLL
jgi:hypothetical protein